MSQETARTCHFCSLTIEGDPVKKPAGFWTNYFHLACVEKHEAAEQERIRNLPCDQVSIRFAETPDNPEVLTAIERSTERIIAAIREDDPVEKVARRCSKGLLHHYANRLRYIADNDFESAIVVGHELRAAMHTLADHVLGPREPVAATTIITDGDRSVMPPAVVEPIYAPDGTKIGEVNSLEIRTGVVHNY